MTGFFKKLFPINEYRKTKIDIYKEMYITTHETSPSFFSHCITPYQSLEEFGQQFRAIPLKFYTCILQATLDLIKSVIALAGHSVNLITGDFPSASQSLVDTINSFGSVIYHLASAIIDLTLTFLAFISRDLATIADGIYQRPKLIQTHEEQKGMMGNVTISPQDQWVPSYD